jgi:hypothetical protein
MTNNISEKDWLLLSRHLAGALSPRQTAALSMRLSSDPDLTEALNQLKRIRALLAFLPEKKIPHNFTIKAGAISKKTTPRIFPIFRIASAVSSLLFVAILGLRFFIPGMQNAPGMMMAMQAEARNAAPVDDSVQLLAPKVATSADGSNLATPDAMTAAGAGVLTESAPVQPVPREEAYSEQEYFPRKSTITWDSIAWSLGILSLTLVAFTINQYLQERV